jgi:glucokinase
MMILAGDIGGTKTNLGLFEVQGEALRSARQHSFPSQDYAGLEVIVTKFMADAPDKVTKVTAACFGIAGPVIEGECATPNLPWVVKARQLAQALNLTSVTLLNDLEATGHGIGELKPGEMLTLNEGEAQPGNAGLIAAGTGLGEASLFWNGHRLVPSASEGGHADFAPRNQLEIDLLRHLLTKFPRVSVERVLSGPGLFNIYDFLRDSRYCAESPEIAARLTEEDPSRVISAAALAGECPLAAKALEMFTAIYGATAGNIALMLKATGGMYVGGGIAPKIIEKLKDGTFMQAFLNKGRLSPLLETIPVRVIMNDKTALLGAARVAANSALGTRR